MRLLNVHNLNITEFRSEATRPKYVIASHRWAEDEATLKDVQEQLNVGSAGFKKVEAFAQFVRERIPTIPWLWIDTCCIDKTSSADLSYSINSMFTWYRDAELCIAHLADIEEVDGGRKFTESNWFTRGWTLQELLAPRAVVFVTKSWEVIGNKGAAFSNCAISELGGDVTEAIAERTKIPDRVLHDWAKSFEIPVNDRIEWMDSRQTSIAEDRWYALFGIVGVAPGTNYGEGPKQAEVRFLEAVDRRNAVTRNDSQEYQEIVKWLSAPNPRSNHDAALKLKMHGSGQWLLDSSEYQVWKSGDLKYLWLHGKAGCGKTIVSSTAIEDMRLFCDNSQLNLGHAFFYFTFSDNSKQSFEHLVRSLVQQLGSKEPAWSRLRHSFKTLERQSAGLNDLRRILLSCTASYDMVFLHIDALDECPKGDYEREYTLERIAEFLEAVPNVRLLMASRDESDIRSHVQRMDGTSINIEARLEEDIAEYIKSRISKSTKLSRLDSDMQQLIKDTLLQKADGMFRWVYCQLHQLERSSSTKPSILKEMLEGLPKTLDETYERMLLAIDENDRHTAYTFLRWLVGATRPLTLAELVETDIIAFDELSTSGGTVNRSDRSQLDDPLRVLPGLVTTDPPEWERLSPSTTVRLAHFSVQEYLESDRLSESCARGFLIVPEQVHHFITQSCLVYLLSWINCSDHISLPQNLGSFYYGDDEYRDDEYRDDKYRDINDRPMPWLQEVNQEWPLFAYAARHWAAHAKLQRHTDLAREIHFLTTAKRTNKGIIVLHMNKVGEDETLVPLSCELTGLDFLLYSGSVLGLTGIVKASIGAGAKVDALAEFCGTALQAASANGRDAVVKALLEAGADVDSSPSGLGTALQAASECGRVTTVETLIAGGANVNAGTSRRPSALELAISHGSIDITMMLIGAGAVINEKHHLRLAMDQAKEYPHWEEMVQVLRSKVWNPVYEHAILVAKTGDIRKMLQEAQELHPNADGREYGWKLYFACRDGAQGEVQRLLAEIAKCPP